ncbi:MAG: hypothetical protein ABSE91_04120 [Patescibacteria group bacterium]|jgi:hypothetical protein
MKKIFQTKKSVALIIALLIITAVAVFAFTAARSIVSSIARTSRDSDAMIAQEAARAGLEYGMLQCKNEPPNSDKAMGSLSSTPDYTSPDLGSGQKFEIWMAISGSGTTSNLGCDIISIGSIGNTYKQYKTQYGKGFVSGTCTDNTNHCAGLACGTKTGTDSCFKSYSITCSNTCVVPNTCSGNTCVCNTYEGDTAFCAKYHATCGSVTGTDQCGNSRTVNCGTTCPIGQACSSSHTCVLTCTAESNAAFCSSYGKTCGSYTNKDNCGNTRVANCGTCSSGYTCTNNVCVASGGTCPAPNLGGCSTYCASRGKHGICGSPKSSSFLNTYCHGGNSGCACGTEGICCCY